MPPLVSVIIATRNRSALLAHTLEALRLQHWPRERFEVIVADNGSCDDTRGVVLRAAQGPDAPSLRYLFVAAAGKSHAVNAALEIARGELFALTDDDVRAEPAWLERHRRRRSNGPASISSRAASGRIWETPPPSWLSPALYGVLAIPDNGSRAARHRRSRRAASCPSAPTWRCGARWSIASAGSASISASWKARSEPAKITSSFCG